MVDLYIKGLPSREFKRYVHLAQPPTMEAAMALARGFQAFEAQSELERGTKKPPKEEAASRAVETAGASPDDKPASQNINQNQHKNGDKGRKYPPLSKTLGDILQSIEKQSKRLDELEKQKEAAPKTSRGPPTCYNCGEVGHMIRGCPKRGKASEKTDAPSDDTTAPALN